MTEYTHYTDLGQVQSLQNLWNGPGIKDFGSGKRSPGSRSDNVQDETLRGPNKAGRILFAEDEEIIRTLTVKLLEKAGYEVLVAFDGVMAKEIFESVKGDIDLVLLDVVMPNADGHEVYDFIKDRDPDMPVLFSTGYGLNSSHTKFIAVQGLSVLRKPYTPAALIEKIQEMLAKRH